MKPSKLLLTLFFLLAIATACKTNTLAGKKTLNFFGDNKPLFSMSLKQYETFLSEYEVVRGTEDAKLWERMKAQSKGGKSEFLSTHPSEERRISIQKEWIPHAKAVAGEIKIINNIN